MRSTYPEDYYSLPRLRLEGPKFNCIYEPAVRVARGLITQANRKGLDVSYIFEVGWFNGKPNERISIADPAKGWGFDDRDWDKGTSAIRELKGLPEGHAPDARAFARRVAGHLFSLYSDDIDFLQDRIESGIACKIAEGGIQTRIKCLYRDGDWLISKEVMPTLRKTLYSAEFLREATALDGAIQKLAELTELRQRDPAKPIWDED